jgi:hypothetical protein
MRTTVDIPDELYKSVRLLAVEQNTSLKQLVVDGLGLLLNRQSGELTRKQFEPPLIHCTRTDKLIIDNETIYDLIDFP